MRGFQSTLLVLVFAQCSLAAELRAAEFYDVEVDLAVTTGMIRPLHGVNSGPLCYRGTVDLTEFHRALAVPLTRLHDVPWVNAEAVDIHTIFPDFRYDPAKPESYRFGPTDEYIRAITNVPSRIVYRLGESIEHTKHKYFVQPPGDPHKWAAICGGVVRHYNEGWADGFRHDIRYWEIWNEPDVRPACWTGTDEEFFRLYEETARTLKRQFPNIKVGGPAVGGTGDFTAEGFKPSAFVSQFLAYCREREVPLDFFSWHRYTRDPWDLPHRAHAMRRVLDEAGFPNTESHLNEWNYLPDDDWRALVTTQGPPRERWFQRMNGPEGAAFAACALMLFQDAPLDAANYYTGEIQGFGLFDFYGTPKATYYAFKAFRQLLDTPVHLSTRGSEEGKLVLLAGTDSEKRQAALLVSSFKGEEREVRLRLRNASWQGDARYEAFAVDETHKLEEIARGAVSQSGSLVFPLKSPGVALVKIRVETLEEKAP